MNEKTYIGKGRQKPGSEYVVLTIDANVIANVIPEGPDHAAKYKIIMARMRQPDRFGNTHTLYIPAKEDAAERVRGEIADQQEMEGRS